MDKYRGLLSGISRQYHIPKGMQETENSWKTRVVYSICGMMAYASLWDNTDEFVSIVHVKKKIRNILMNYKTLYPEIALELPYEPDEFEEEVVNLFLDAGMVYHCPNRVVPAMRHEEALGKILFQRGIALDDITCVSGMGLYSVVDTQAESGKVKEMFGLERNNLQTLWEEMISTNVWESNLSFASDTEYLLLEPPFTSGYWTNKPDKTGIVSILRTGMKGEQLYYIYRYEGNALEACPIPKWRTEGSDYRTLACACLSSCGKLPPIEYSEDGALIHIQLPYLLPPGELNFLKLYSWPEKCTTFPCNFRRKLSVEVFAAIKNILSNEGYEFKEKGYTNAKRSKFYT